MEQLEFEFADGRKREKEESLSELMGIAECNPFQVSNRPEMVKKLEFMTVGEVISLNYRLGLTPESNETLARKKLLNAYDDFIKKSEAKKPTGRKYLLDPKDEKNKALIRLMAE